MKNLKSWSNWSPNWINLLPCRRVMSTLSLHRNSKKSRNLREKLPWWQITANSTRAETTSESVGFNSLKLLTTLNLWRTGLIRNSTCPTSLLRILGQLIRFQRSSGIPNLLSTLARHSWCVSRTKRWEMLSFPHEFSIVDDLTSLNAQLLNRLKNSELIVDAWSWQSKIFAKLTNDKIVVARPYQTADDLYKLWCDCQLNV